MNVKLINVSNDPEGFIAYIARVSNPKNQNNPEYAKLLKYMIKNGHWSPFEHSFMAVEIKTNRAIAAQILRHRSFSFQEFSQRYSEALEIEPIELRRQAEKNRQSSTDVIDPLIGLEGIGYGKSSEIISSFISRAQLLYKTLIAAGVAKESARFILPLATQTTLYMSGSARSWIHYIQLRTKEDVQKEHREIALEIEKIFALYFPITYEAMQAIKKEESDKTLLYRLLSEGKIILNE
jgi:thymidylate synthase (FAD)